MAASQVFCSCDILLVTSAVHRAVTQRGIAVMGRQQCRGYATVQAIIFHVTSPQSRLSLLIRARILGYHYKRRGLVQSAA